MHLWCDGRIFACGQEIRGSSPFPPLFFINFKPFSHKKHLHMLNGKCHCQSSVGVVVECLLADKTFGVPTSFPLFLIFHLFPTLQSQKDYIAQWQKLLKVYYWCSGRLLACGQEVWNILDSSPFPPLFFNFQPFNHKKHPEHKGRFHYCAVGLVVEF